MAHGGSTTPRGQRWSAAPPPSPDAERAHAAMDRQIWWRAGGWIQAPVSECGNGGPWMGLAGLSTGYFFFLFFLLDLWRRANPTPPLIRH